MIRDDQVNEIMRLASLMATARVRRYAAKQSALDLPAAERRVAKAEAALRAFAEKALSCPK